MEISDYTLRYVGTAARHATVDGLPDIEIGERVLQAFTDFASLADFDALIEQFKSKRP